MLNDLLIFTALVLVIVGLILWIAHSVIDLVERVFRG